MSGNSIDAGDAVVSTDVTTPKEKVEQLAEGLYISEERYHVLAAEETSGGDYDAVLAIDHDVDMKTDGSLCSINTTQGEIGRMEDTLDGIQYVGAESPEVAEAELGIETENVVLTFYF